MINLAVIGSGHWGPNHIRTFNGLGGARVVAVVDKDAKRLVKIGELFPGIALEADAARVFANPEIHAVVIATPTNTHHALVRDALLAGKHVLCEKPLCETGDEGRALVALARERQRVLMIGHVFLFNSGITKVKELLDAGELGALYYLSAVRTNLGPIRRDVNAAYDLAAHDISIFNWFLGSEPETVSASGAAFLQPGIEDIAFINLKYPRNVFANIQVSWLNPKKVRQITVVGSKKMVTWDDLEMNAPVAIYDRGVNVAPETTTYGEFLRLSMWEGDVRLPKVNLEEPLKAQDRHFLEAVRGAGGAPRSDGAFGASVVRVLEAVGQSLRTNGAPVAVLPA